MSDPAVIEREIPLSPWSSPDPIAGPVMLHRWEDLSFLHRSYQPDAVQRLLPAGLRVDQFGDEAWVGLVLFRLTVTLPGIHPIPWASSCPEVNVRTYVVGPDGRRGIWFFSLDASRLGAVLAARSWYRLPYMWSRMQLVRRSGIVQYRSERRWPGPGHPRAAVALALGEALEPLDVSPLERFLLARWRLYSLLKRGVGVARVEHEPWPLTRARVLSLKEELTAAVGLPVASGPAIAHYSPGVEARFAARVRVM
jgi:uncharacterized protein YqjF (DUF2071 family)